MKILNTLIFFIGCGLNLAGYHCLAAEEQTKVLSDSSTLKLTVQLGPGVKLDSLFLFFSEPVNGKAGSGDSLRSMKKMGQNSFLYHVQAGATAGQLVVQTSALTGSILKAASHYVTLTPTFYWKKGDNLTLTINRRSNARITGSPLDDYAFEFQGRGSGKYTAREKIVRAYINAEPELASEISDTAAYGDLLRPKVIGALSMLEQVRPLLSGYYYNLFKADIIGWQISRFRHLKALCDTKPLMYSSACAGFLLKNLHSDIDSIADEIPASVAANSVSYARYLYEKLLFERIASTAKDSVFDYISVIAGRYQPGLRDKLLLSLFTNHIESKDLNTLYKRTRLVMTDKRCLAALDERARELPGMEPAEFNLPDLQGKQVQLTDFRGKVVFLDIWFSGCGACTLYYRKVLKEAEEALKTEKDIVFVSISADREKDLWKRSVASGKYSSPDIVNLYTEGKGTAHEWIRNYGFQSFPKMIILNKKGQIQSIYENGLASGINTASTLVETLKKALIEN